MSSPRPARPATICAVALVLLPCLLLGGCGKDHGEHAPGALPAAPPDLAQVAKERASLILHVSNQSEARPLVDATIWIDGRRAFAGELRAGEGDEFQHLWQTLAFDLAPGLHRLKAVTHRGQATYEGVIEIGRKHWATLDYWADAIEGGGGTKGRFAFDVSDEPVYFE